VPVSRPLPPARRAARRPARRPARAGLTLVELLVASTLGALVVTAAAALFAGQLRAYLRVRGAAAVQRDLRLGMALLPMDLRGAARRDGNGGASDFVALTDTMIELRATIASSVICAVPAPAKTQLILPPRDQPGISFTAYHAVPQAGDTVKVLVRTAAGGVGDRWLTAAVGADGLTPAPTSTAGRLCQWATPQYPRLSLPLVWQPAPVGPTGAELDSVTPGMPVRVLRTVRYALYRAPSGRWYLGYQERQAGGGWSEREPIAGPYEAAAGPARAGVRFAYFDTNGVALATPAVAARVGRIDVTLRPRAQVRAGTGTDSVVVRDSAVVRVALRNRF
jgi:hypothetical protein